MLLLRGHLIAPTALCHLPPRPPTRVLGKVTSRPPGLRFPVQRMFRHLDHWYPLLGSSSRGLPTFVAYLSPQGVFSFALWIPAIAAGLPAKGSIAPGVYGRIASPLLLESGDTLLGRGPPTELCTNSCVTA